MANSVQRLPEELTDTVLATVGLSGRRAPTLRGLKAVFLAWCRRTQAWFVNVR
jgi:hypothetical protein